MCRSNGIWKIVIGTNGSSMEQLITNAYNGLLAQPDDSNSLFEKLYKQLNWTKKVSSK